MAVGTIELPLSKLFHISPEDCWRSRCFFHSSNLGLVWALNGVRVEEHLGYGILEASSASVLTFSLPLMSTWLGIHWHFSCQPFFARSFFRCLHSKVHLQSVLNFRTGVEWSFGVSTRRSTQPFTTFTGKVI